MRIAILLKSFQSNGVFREHKKSQALTKFIAPLPNGQRFSHGAKNGFEPFSVVFLDDVINSRGELYSRMQDVPHFFHVRLLCWTSKIRNAHVFHELILH
jgi:uncharacterized protein YeaO (DUF488 family)